MRSFLATNTAILTLALTPAFAGTFDAATETFAQSQPAGTWSAQLAIDGNLDGTYHDTASNGWAILTGQSPDPTPAPQTAYFRFTAPFQLTSDLPSLKIELIQRFNPDPGLPSSLYHTLGAFRISVTSSDLHAIPFNATSASLAAWSVLEPDFLMIKPDPAVPSPGYTVDPSGTVFVNLPGMSRGDYIFTATPLLSSITGIRLEAFSNPALPTGGPGFPSNGNFVLNEILADHFRTVPGDATFDYRVDAFDLNIVAAHWQQQYGADWSSGDFNADGEVDAFDLNILASNWQRGADIMDALHATPPTAAVPEPASLLTLLPAFALFSARRTAKSHQKSSTT